MKAIGLLLVVMLMLIPVTAALAQSTTTDSGSSAPSAAPPAPSKDQPGASIDVRTNDKGGADVKATIDRGPGESRPSARDDRADGSAFPRTSAPQRTTVFGLSPAGAIVVAAALLVVVILAIVAMARSGDRTTYVERDRRF